MVTQLGPDIQESEVKWALGSIYMNKSGADDGIQTELFQILKVNVVKVLQILKTQKGPQDWKRFIFFPIPKKGKAK